MLCVNVHGGLVLVGRGCFFFSFFFLFFLCMIETMGTCSSGLGNDTSVMSPKGMKASWRVCCVTC